MKEKCRMYGLLGTHACRSLKVELKMLKALPQGFPSTSDTWPKESTMMILFLICRIPLMTVLPVQV